MDPRACETKIARDKKKVKLQNENKFQIKFQYYIQFQRKSLHDYTHRSINRFGTWPRLKIGKHYIFIK